MVRIDQLQNQTSGLESWFLVFIATTLHWLLIVVGAVMLTFGEWGWHIAFKYLPLWRIFSAEESHLPQRQVLSPL